MKQQQLNFEKGITNVPSDALCADSALEESIGMVFDNGEHRVIQKPVTDSISVASGHTLLYIHKVAGGENAITTYGSTIYFNNSQLCAGSVSSEVTSIGNTLIINSGGTITYLLWKPNSYTNLGHGLPEVYLEFILEEPYGSSTWYAGLQNRQEHGDCIFFQSDRPYVREQKVYNDLVVGLYAKNRKAHHERREFLSPFMVRYALELYDGTYTHASAPILLFPSVRQHCFAEFYSSDTLKNFFMTTRGCRLKYKAQGSSGIDLSDWSDIIKDIVVFASEEVSVYDLARDQDPEPAFSGLITDGVIWRDGVYRYILDNGSSNYHDDISTHGSVDGNNYVLLPLKKRDEMDILNDIKSISNFYKIFTIGLYVSNSFSDASYRIERSTLETLNTKQRLTDDYFSHCPMGADSIYAYNKRLILGNVKRGFFPGFHHFMPGGTSTGHSAVVSISTPEGTKTAQTSFSSSDSAMYFFYPDPRARSVTFDRTAHGLEEHTALNGAFYISGLPSSSISSSGSAVSDSVDTPENLNNRIFVSEVNNPFLFKPEGDITVGNGNIIGLSTLTKALSEGQFGQFPLIIFTTEGIWAASVATTGIISNVHPMSREVAKTDNPCITQTDGAIFFASQKGLMVVVGSQVNCVSEQLSGRSASPFAAFLNSAKIAYDYRDSMLWLVNGTRYAYIYNIKSGTFARFDFGTNTNKHVFHVVNDYPDYLLQCDDKSILSLMRRPDINNDGTTSGQTFTPNTYSARLISRPMKLENALALKTIIQARHIYDFHTGENKPTIALTIKASNNLKTWVQLNSLRGMPWKYYKFQYDFTNLFATDRFAGTVLITEERRTNKLR